MSAPLVSRIAHASSLSSPPWLEADDMEWWSHLDPDFAQQPEAFALGTVDRLRVGSTAASDVVVRTLGAMLVGGLAGPLGYRPSRVREAIEDAGIYAEAVRDADPAAFFPAPPPPVVTTRRARPPLFRPRDGTCEDLSFESAYVPLNPRLRPRFARAKRNRVAHARYWRHGDGPRPTVMAIHGFSADLYLLNEWLFALPWLYRIGLDVCLVTLPFHGRRASRRSPFSGHGFFAGGIHHINECFGQAVHDFRGFVTHLLEARGAPRVGVMGVSLGGFTSALLAATEPRLRFAIPSVPVASLPDLVLEWEPMASAARLMMRQHGVTLPELRQLLAVSSPLSYRARLPPERLFVIGGVGDRLASPKHTRLLWDHWGRCRLHWFPGSHLLHLDRGAYLREVARFFRAIGFFDGLAPPARRRRRRR
jgi:pimeloyl-ACP methyl ester carboxylesterase